MSAAISVKTRKRLWLKSGGCCAFPECKEPLLEPIETTDDDTVIGIECHIVAQQDSPNVARSVTSLTDDERETFANLIEDRHGYANLVLMCARHSIVIDDPAAGFTVAQVVQMKREHTASIASQRSPDEKRADELVFRVAAIIDEWERRVALDEWTFWLGPVFGDGHPHMRRDDFDRLTETRRWMFSRVWTGKEPDLQDAFENFRHVAQDLQLVLEQYPHETLAKSGVVAVTRFYNDSNWVRRVDDHHELDDMYEWYAYLLEDLALELTRAANLVCEAVRQTIDPRYRVEEGLVILESGPYEDLMTRLHRPQYAPSDGWRPYPGLRRFLSERATRAEYRDATAKVPRFLRLPGDSLFPLEE
jgi:hypothetical protein